MLIREKRILHGLFFSHLVIEKAIKNHMVKTSGEVAHKSHNLVYLSEKTNLAFDIEKEIFMGILMKYKFQGLYHDYYQVQTDILKFNEYFEKTKTLLQWLKEKL
jgi:hypothetical protein